MMQTTRRSRSSHPPRRKPPSRVKYEGSHPTVSCRVSRAVYERLQAAKEAEGKSFADILKAGLGLQEARAKEEGGIRKQARAEGYRKGYAEAQRLYAVTYLCKVCGKPIAVASTGEKEGIKQYMQEHGWGHGACHERKR